MGIKRIRLFVNKKDKSKEVEKELRNKLIENGFSLTDLNDFDLGIAIGGDGTFLRMIRDSYFREDKFYVGVNLGTLGFAQDVEYHEIDAFINNLKKEEFFYEEIGIQTVEIKTVDGLKTINSLNEIVVRDEKLKTFHIDVLIDKVLLEHYVGDGLLISTSFGSTAYNLSFGGSMVYNEFDTLQLTPIAPILNKSYPTLANSLILPSTKEITLIPNKRSIIITSDGNSEVYSNVEYIKINIKQHIRLIRKPDYNYIKKINDKFIQ